MNHSKTFKSRSEQDQGIILEISDINHEGEGVARLRSKSDDADSDVNIYFVPKTSIGDVVSCKVVGKKKKITFAKAEQVLTPSPFRINPDCVHYDKCGGCELRHIKYSVNQQEKNETPLFDELSLKKSWVINNLVRIGKVDFESLEGYSMKEVQADRLKMLCDNTKILHSDSFMRYRNNVQFAVRKQDGRVRFGFFKKNSHELVSLDDCLLLTERFIKIAIAFCAFIEKSKISVYDDKTGKGIVKHLFLREGKKTGEVMVCVVLNGYPDDTAARHKLGLVEVLTSAFPEISTVVLNFNKNKSGAVLGEREEILFGEGYINDIVLGNKYRISPKSFYQINHQMMEMLYLEGFDFLNNSLDKGGKNVLLDLYCGIGIIGLTMAAKNPGMHLIGVDIVASAVENAKNNALLNGIENADFICADAVKAFKVIKEKSLPTPNIVLLDPPRKGVDASLIEEIASNSPEKILYISCNSATLARDLNILEAKGYKMKKLSTVNMFPRTKHVECVVMMSRTKD